MIYGNRMRLRAPEREDTPKFKTWINDPEVRRGLSMALPISQVEEDNWFDSMIKRPAEEHPLTIEIADGEGWKAIGNIGLMNFDWRCRSAEVGIFIGEKALWNQGYGSEAMTLMLQNGFETLNLNRIFLRVHADNPRAIRSYEKVGYQHEGRFRQAEHKDGQYIDVLFMSILRAEWIRGKA
jgi:RimJ/RimL family protein N-acetyltransferase